MYWKSIATAAVGLCLTAGSLVAGELRIDGEDIGSADGIVRFEANYEFRRILITTDGSVAFSRIDESQDAAIGPSEFPEDALAVQVIDPAKPNEILSRTVIGSSSLVSWFLVNNQNDNVRIKTNGNLKVEVVTIPIIESFQASASNLLVGDAVTLEWASTDTDSCAIEGSASRDDLPSTGSVELTPATTGQKSYTLVCEDSRGITVSDGPVVVSVSNQPPVSIDFSATNEVIDNGASTLLAWTTENATSCTGSGPGFGGNRNTSGSVSVSPSPEGEYVYRLECDGPGAADSSELVITVVTNENPGVEGLCDDIDTTTSDEFEIVCFEAAATEISTGEPLTISWAATGANHCQGTAAFEFINTTPGISSSGVIATKGKYTFNETRSGILNYGLRCFAPGGDMLTRSVSVRSTDGGGDPTAPKIRSFTSTATDVLIDSTYSLNWDVINVNSCTASGDWSGSKPLVGSQEFDADALGDRSYTLQCTNGTTVVSKTVEVEVVNEGSGGDNPGPLGIITSFNASRVSVPVGQSVTFAWTTTGASGCRGRSPVISPWTGPLHPANGSINVQITTVGDKTFVLECFGAGTGETDRSEIEIAVTGTALPPVGTSLSVNKSSIIEGETVRFTYSSSNATSCRKTGIAPGWSGNLSATSGTIDFVPSHDSMSFSYGIRCSNATSHDERSVSVNSELPAQTFSGNCPVPYEPLLTPTWAETFGSVWPMPASWNELLQIQRGKGWAISFRTGGVGTSGSIVSAPITGGSYVRMGSFSECPGDYTVPEDDCIQRWTEGQRLNFNVATSTTLNNNSCELLPNTNYYFNIRYSSACTGSSCRGIFDYDLD